MLKLFLVEDEVLIREGLRDNIPWEQFGYQFVGEAGDGEMALPMIRRIKPDVLLTDIKMPFMDGLSLSKMVAAELPKTKIIIMSGYDEFEYAREAIEIGVEQYLLKPITKAMLKKTLTELKEKIEQDSRQNEYQMMYQSEMHEYEQFSRRRFFEKLFEGEMSVSDIYQEAGKLSLELDASAYGLLFFCFQEKRKGNKEEMEQLAQETELALHFFLRNPQYLLFRWNMNCYGVLLMGEWDKMDALRERAIENIRKRQENVKEYADGYVAYGSVVERLSSLPEVYREVNHFFSYRFIYPDMHLLCADTLETKQNSGEEDKLTGINPAQMDPEVIKLFIQNGSRSEIPDFVDGYLNGVKSALKTRMFRDYLILNIRFTVMAYLNMLGITEEQAMEEMQFTGKELELTAENVESYFADMLRVCFYFGKQETDNQSRRILRKAVEYIDEHFDQDTLSLNSVAEAIEVSANYLSAVFSQGMEKTFVEYVTGKRMEKAKKLLKNTDKSTGDIALEVGYKDPHYFSFVFKKTQKMNPREYRGGKGK